MPFCTTCGASVAGSFCTQCGTPVNAASAQPAAPTPNANASTAPGPRKTSPWVWVLVVILGIFLLGGLAVGGLTLFVAHKVRQAGVSPDLFRQNPAAATARILAAANPDIEIVSEDDSAGTVTVRDRKSGKTMTWNFDQAKEGRFRITADDENGKHATIDIGPGSTANLPAWVPTYPGANAKVTFAVTGTDSDKAGGSFTFSTPDSADKVLSFYRDQIDDLGMKVQAIPNTPTSNTITAADDDRRRSLTVVVHEAPGNTNVNVSYGAKP